MKKWIKKLLHRHEYSVLEMYPPRPRYNNDEWGFLIRCKCGHKKLTKLPRNIKVVEKIVDYIPEGYC